VGSRATPTYEVPVSGTGSSATPTCAVSGSSATPICEVSGCSATGTPTCEVR
jgi:hypothetical protein